FVTTMVMFANTFASAAEILTPPPLATPTINGPTIYGQRPGRPFLYRIPATSDRPITFAVEGLPPGLALYEKTGQIKGKRDHPGEYQTTIRASNAKGTAQKKFKIVIGDSIA